MAYTRINWQDGPQGGTPLSAANLNHMDQGIADAHDLADAAQAAADAARAAADAAQATADALALSMMHASASGTGNTLAANGVEVANGGEIIALSIGKTVKLWAVDFYVSPSLTCQVAARRILPPALDIIYDGSSLGNSGSVRAPSINTPLVSYTAPDNRILVICLANTDSANSRASSLTDGMRIKYTVE